MPGINRIASYFNVEKLEPKMAVKIPLGVSNKKLQMTNVPIIENSIYLLNKR
jgi:hypothetical protein